MTFIPKGQFSLFPRKMRRCNSPNLQGIQCLVHSNWNICSLLRIGIGAMGDAKDATPRPMTDTRCIDVHNRSYLFPADGAKTTHGWVSQSSGERVKGFMLLCRVRLPRSRRPSEERQCRTRALSVSIRPSARATPRDRATRGGRSAGAMHFAK